ncbi:MAG: hypothetical protein PHD51_02395 [Patescibacteria group bacterium]|nr:hypothetical protein [Patescibacteria group bacterium]MDD5490289.1 hypothetical protein [Patescibacteria group bacterium]
MVTKTSSKSFSVSLYKKIAVSFITLTLILVILILYLSFSQAKISIWPVKKMTSADLLVDIIRNSEIEGVLAGDTFEITVEGEGNFSPTGGKEVEGVAEGKVTIFNNYNRNQPLVTTTRFLTKDGLLFRLKKGTLVPAGGKVEAEVYADKAGKAYEVGPSKFTIPGLWEGLQDKIFAESFEKMSGGVKAVKIINEDDIAKGKEELEKKFFEEGVSKLNELAGKNLNNNLIFKEILESSTDVMPGDEVGEFTMAIKLKLVAVDVDEDKLLSLAETKMKNSLSSDRRLVEINKDSARYSLGKYDLENGTATLNVYLEGETVLRETSLIFNKDNLTGRSRAEAEAYLKGFDSIDKVEVHFSPFWVTKVPKLKDHIKMEIK